VHKKLFKFYNLKHDPKIRHAEEPKDLITWIKHGFSEFIGTFVLSLALAGLSTVVASTTNEKSRVVEEFMVSPILVGFYAGFIAVGFVLIVFLRWSCDLNPAVTITRMLRGTNTYRYGFYKIFIQFLGALLAGLVIWAFGHLADVTMKDTSDHVYNHAISAEKVYGNIFDPAKGTGHELIKGGVAIFAIETVITSLLLWPIFSPTISEKHRDWIIMLSISMTVWMAILGGSAALNPARGIAQQFPAIFSGPHAGNLESNADLIASTVSMEVGTFFGPFFYLFMRGFVSSYLNPIVHKMIAFRNTRTSNMRFDSQDTDSINKVSNFERSEKANYNLVNTKKPTVKKKKKILKRNNNKKK